MTPEWIEAKIGHLENAAHVEGFLSVKEKISLGRVSVNISLSFQESKCHEGIEKVACRARVQAKASAKGIEGLRAVRQFRENTYFDSTQECL